MTETKNPEKPKRSKAKKKDAAQHSDHSLYVPQKDKIDFDLHIRDFPFTEKQKAFLELALDKNTRVVFVDGPAGTAKTCLAVYVALQMLQERKHGQMIYVRSLVESAGKGMGFLPGEAKDKFAPFAEPLIDKLEEFLGKKEIDLLIKKEHVKGTPLNFLRGKTYNATTVIFDEWQNADVKETVTALTRLGKFSKFFFLGDHNQSDLELSGSKQKSGFGKIIAAYDTERSQKRGIFCVKFGKEDIMRDELLSFIIEQLELAGLI